MIIPPKPENESQRLRTLQSLNILDTPPEERFDRYTRLARRLFGVPIALVSLVDADRQWFKSRCGLDAAETPRDISFCGHAILEDEPMIVTNAMEDERFADNPLVTCEPNIRFYAGAQLTAPDGSVLGTLCLIDQIPRDFSAADRVALRDLADMLAVQFTALTMATTDELTGLTNRRGFHALAEKALCLCRRQKDPVTLITLDLDGFKEINDQYGHQEGDRALVEVANLLLENFRDSDVPARIGGDEFIVLLVGADADQAACGLQRLENTLSARNACASSAYNIHFSAGIMEFNNEDHASIDELIHDADRRMYRNKQKAGKQVSQAQSGPSVPSTLALQCLSAAPVRP